MNRRGLIGRLAVALASGAVPYSVAVESPKPGAKANGDKPFAEHHLALQLSDPNARKSAWS